MPVAAMDYSSTNFSADNMRHFPLKAWTDAHTDQLTDANEL